MSQCPSCGGDCGGGNGKSCKYKGEARNIVDRLKMQIVCFEQEYNDPTDDTWDGEISLCKGAIDRIEELEKASDFDHAEYKRLLAESKVDAERYRWLRAADWDDIERVFWHNEPVNGPEEYAVEVDAAVDAARGAK